MVSGGGEIKRRASVGFGPTFVVGGLSRERKLVELGKSDTGSRVRPEYDVKSLPVRRFGPGRKSFGGSVVRLEPDVAESFPTADAVNEALRFLIRIAKENKPTSRGPGSRT